MRNSPHLASSRAPDVSLEFQAGRPGGGFECSAAVFMGAGPVEKSNFPQPFRRGQDVESKSPAATFAGTGRLAYSGSREWFDGGGAMSRRIFARHTGMEGGAGAMKSTPGRRGNAGFRISVKLDKFR